MKKFKNYTYFFGVLFLATTISCKTNENETLNLKTTLADLQTQTSTLEEELDETRRAYEKARNFYYDYRLDIDEVRGSTPEKMSFLTHKKEVLKIIFNDLELDEYPVYFGLTDFFRHIREKSIPKVLNDKISFIKYQLFLFNRSSNNIKKLFTDETIDMIASFFKGNSYYEDSGAKYYIEGLLVTQGSLEFKEDSEEVLREYYNSLNEEYGWVSDKTLAMDTELFDKKVIRYFENAHFSNYDEVYRKDAEGNLTDIPAFLFTKRSYSFWARRYHEGNQEIVSEILYNIHYKITGNELLWGEE